MIRDVFAIGLAALFVIVVACKGNSPTGGCIDDGDCGELQICNESARCVDVECTSSSYCAIEQYCDDATHECTDGCAVDEDCKAGDACDEDAHTCEPYGCRDTALDCGYGEFCENGDCVEADGPFCKPCNNNNQCEGQGTCFTFSDNNNYCLVICDPDRADECPRGYFCAQASDYYTDYYCVADCPTMQ